MVDMTKVEVAEHYGVDPRTVNNWIAAGLPIKVKSGKGGSGHIFDSREVSKWKEARAIDLAVGNTDLMSTDEARRKKLSAEAALMELELAKKQGLVIDLEEVERELSNKFASLRAAVRRIPDRTVMSIVGLKDETAIKQILLEEIDQVLNMLADGDDE